MRHASLSRPLAEWRPSGVLFLVLEVLSRAGALLLVLGFLAAGPVSLLGLIRGQDGAALSLALFALAAGFIAVTALIHLEERYIFGVFPALILSSLPILGALFAQVRARAGGVTS